MSEEAKETLIYVDVILPLNIQKTYTYVAPSHFIKHISIGKRVVVQFGKRKLYTALVCNIHTIKPELYEAKSLMDVLDEAPLVNSLQMKLWVWISAYYMCPLGDIMQAALPSALKLTSETKISLKEATYNEEELTNKEHVLIKTLSTQKELSIGDISKLLKQKNVFALLKTLLQKGVIHIFERLDERYKPKKQSLLRLNPLYASSEARKKLMHELARAPKQLDALLAFLKLSKQNVALADKLVLNESHCGHSALKALISKGVFTVQEKEVSCFGVEEVFQPLLHTLTHAQNEVLQQIEIQFSQKDVVLLHGVTASGKTQIYIKLIAARLACQGQVLYLLPEIALTTQMIERLRKVFGDKIGVYHSKLSDNQRVEVWNKLLNKEYDIVLGARSALFLPFKNLALVIVDEEHEPSYKQFDPSPRYHARDTAIYLARICGAKVLLGSATPSLDTYYNTQVGKYGFVELTQRYGGANQPKIEIVGLVKAKKSQTAPSYFSETLLAEISHTLERKEQVILFQNRRGYAPFLLCRTCGYIPKCIHCDVSLTLHKSSGKLHCHYCGYKQGIVVICPACGLADIEQKGVGTEKVEDELAILFPKAHIARMDLDAARTRNHFLHILNELQERKIDILVGTQMVTKGLDFEHVTLIGVLDADSLLSYPDFRAHERSYQMLAQVAGRAGRREKEGKVLIQAYDADHYILKLVVESNYKAMATLELEERQNFCYPPFYRLITLSVKHKNIEQAQEAAKNLANGLKKLLGERRILGPQMPLVGRVKNYYISSILIKMERLNFPVHKTKQQMQYLLLEIEKHKAYHGVRIQANVDPY